MAEFKNQIDDKILKTRKIEREEDLRGHYFRDTTAIIHSFPYRRLKHKTQVFFAPKNDHICTRIEHVMHVASISATICKAINIDADLAWAIGLGHDLGHTPFGHLGEQILTKIMKSDKEKFGGRGFKHEIYSLRVVDHLASYGKGLNLTYAVRDGIISHCGEKFEQEIKPDFKIKELEQLTKLNHYPSTWEGCVVRMADKIAYLGRDLEDACQLELISIDEIPENCKKVLGYDNRSIINKLVLDVITNSQKTESISFSDEVYQAVRELVEFNYKKIYKHPKMTSYNAYFERILSTIYQYLSDLFCKYGKDFEKYKEEKNTLALRFSNYLKKMENFYTQFDKNYNMAVIDYIAGMTDYFAIDSLQEIMLPKSFEYAFEKGFM